MGIKTMQQRAEERNSSAQKTQTRELWLKDDDEARISILTNESEDENGVTVDPYFSYFYVRRATDDSGFTKKYFLCENREDIPDEYRNEKGVISEQLGFWCYVYYILHKTNTIKDKNGLKEMKDWVEVKRGTSVRYREEVKDFRLYIGGLGQKRAFESDLNSLVMEVGSLEGYIVRLSKERTGSNPMDVLYKARETRDKTNIPEDKLEEMNGLPSVLDYAKEHLVPYVRNKKVDNEVNNEPELVEESDGDELF